MHVTPATMPLSEDEIRARADAFLATLSPNARADVDSKIQTIGWHESVGCLHPDMYIGKRVLDWEAGMGGFAAAFYCLGASEVVAIDSWVDPSSIPHEYQVVDAISFQKITISDYVNGLIGNETKFDFIFANTVTEHIADLPSAFKNLWSIIKNDGLFMNVHDNYYSPCGSHDHGFWFYGDAGLINFQGVDCWSLTAKCNASSDHRGALLKQMPWTWNDRLEAKRNPTDCGSCPYFKRSQPWAHLQYVDDFVETFDDRSFLTQQEGSSLNKLTTFQIRQMLNEAKFNIEHFYRNRCLNSVPDNLTEFGFSPLELTTTTSVWRCSKVLES